VTWTAPEFERVDEPFVGDERAVLDGFLDFARGTLLVKCAGLTGPQLADRALPPSTLSLLGLVRHMADVERSWFRRRLDQQDLPHLFGTDDRPDDDFDATDPARADDDLATYQVEVDAAREVASRHGLDDTGVARSGKRVDLRWIYLHMIEEYARHNGHADLLRECIDGATGD
jgi:hypothetical protein